MLYFFEHVSFIKPRYDRYYKGAEFFLKIKFLKIAKYRQVFCFVQNTARSVGFGAYSSPYPAHFAFRVHFYNQILIVNYLIHVYDIICSYGFIIKRYIPQCFNI